MKEGLRRKLTNETDGDYCKYNLRKVRQELKPNDSLWRCSWLGFVVWSLWGFLLGGLRRIFDNLHSTAFTQRLFDRFVAFSGVHRWGVYAE